MSIASREPLIERSAEWSDVHAALVGAQKSNRNAPAYSRWVNRPVGRVFAATAYKWGLSPNAISIISAACSFTALIVLALATPSLGSGLLVAALLVLGYALDSADGQVARLSGGGSARGEWLDHMFDAVKTSAFHLAVLIMWFRNLGDWPEWTLLIPLVFALQSSVWFFGLIVTELLLRAGGRKPVLAIDEGPQRRWTSLAGIPADYGVLCISMALLGWFDGWRVLYALLALANVLILAVQLVRWYRRL